MTSAVPVATAFEYDGDGVTVEFSFPLRFLENADLAVYVDDTLKTIGTHYSVEGAGELAGGTVTFNEGDEPADGSVVRLERRTAAKQTVDLEDDRRVPGDTLELQLDRLTMAMQDRDVDGPSAYEVAVASGFVGDIETWLDSLVGPRGEQGDKGDPGPVSSVNGDPGPDVVVGAGDISFTPAAGLSSTDLQAAVEEVSGAIATAVSAAISNLVDGAGPSLDTLKELADAINDDASFASTMTAALAAKLAGSTGSTDNALLRADGTGGKTAQTSGVVVDDSNNVTGVAGLTVTGLVDASGATAGQIKFPAAANASADANTLDDYEEGTWTPALNFGGNAVGIAYSSGTLGRYTKIGRLVTVTANLALSSKGSSTGQAQLVGLPCASLNDTIVSAAAVGFASGFSSVTGAVLGIVQPNASKINFYASANGSAVALTNANFTNTSSLLITATYEAA